MVPPKKPEWFQLTDGEAHNQPNRRKRFIKIAALTAPLRSEEHTSELPVT